MFSWETWSSEGRGTRARLCARVCAVKIALGSRPSGALREALADEWIPHRQPAWRRYWRYQMRTASVLAFPRSSCSCYPHPLTLDLEVARKSSAWAWVSMRLESVGSGSCVGVVTLVAQETLPTLVSSHGQPSAVGLRLRSQSQIPATWTGNNQIFPVLRGGCRWSVVANGSFVYQPWRSLRAAWPAAGSVVRRHRGEIVRVGALQRRVGVVISKGARWRLATRSAHR